MDVVRDRRTIRSFGQRVLDLNRRPADARRRPEGMPVVERAR